MDPSAAMPAAPAEAGWDLAYTRLARTLRAPIEACADDLSQRFQRHGLVCERQARPTPRGRSTFVAAVGPRGLLFIVEITLIDGMATGRRAAAALELRLLDACGDGVASCAPIPCVPVLPAAAADPAQTLPLTRSAEDPAVAALARSATSIYLLALAHFELGPRTGAG